jgi:hypothetical protein
MPEALLRGFECMREHVWEIRFDRVRPNPPSARASHDPARARPSAGVPLAIASRNAIPKPASGGHNKQLPNAVTEQQLVYRERTYELYPVGYALIAGKYFNTHAITTLADHKINDVRPPRDETGNGTYYPIMALVPSTR